MKNRLEYKTDLLQMEGQGFTRTEIVQHLADKHHVSTKLGYYYFKTRAQWQPEILGLNDAKDGYHQTLNRLEYIYRRFSMIAATAPEYSNRVGALKGMLEAIRTKAEITGVLGPTAPILNIGDDRLDAEVFKTLTEEENTIIMRATDLFLTKKKDVLAERNERSTT